SLDNVSFLDCRFVIRDEGLHGCLQSLGSVCVSALGRNAIRGLKEPGWERHSDSRRFFSHSNHPQHSITLSILLQEKYYQDEILYYPNPTRQPNHSAKLNGEPSNSSMERI